MIQLFLHLFGDYFLQNDWMAVNKSKYSYTGWLACWIHCNLYALPFWLYYQYMGHHPVGTCSWLYLWILFAHFLLDKFSLAQYWTRLINWNWKWDDDNLYGWTPGRPKWVVGMVHIIRDNSLHLFCNYLIIQHFIYG